MKFRITDGAAAALIFLAITTRIVSGFAIETPELGNAGWLAALLGGLLCLPAAFAVSRLRRAHSPVLAADAPFFLRFLCVIPAFSALIDAACTVTGISHSAAYIDLGLTSRWALLLPQLLLCLWALRQNGEAIGAAARLWKRIFLLLLVVILLIEFRALRPAWLTPLLGSGLSPLLDSALKAAGWLSLALGVILISEKEEDHPERDLHPVRLVAACTLLAAVLLAIQNMMTPPLTDSSLSSRYFQFDALLSNGRAPLSLQFPILIVWFVGMLMLLLFDAFVFAALLQRIFPVLPGFVCILFAGAGAAGLSVAGIAAPSIAPILYRWIFVLQTAAILIITLSIQRKREVSQHA